MKIEHLDDNDYKIKAKFTVPENEKLFGMGQYQNGKFDLKNSVISLYQENKQVSIPYVISSKGYGFFWHNPSIGQAEFTNDKMIWTARCTEKLDFWVVAEDTPKDLVREYSNVTGKAPAMPEYAMGFWQSRLRYWNQEQLLDVAREYKKRNIPLDIIMCDFYHYPTLGDMKFDSELFPEDEKCWSISDEYMYGADMLVAPITEQFSTKRTVYLPKGAKWQSAINGKIYEGGQTIKVNARIDQIPVFLRNSKHYDLVKQIAD